MNIVLLHEKLNLAEALKTITNSVSYSYFVDKHTDPPQLHLFFLQ